MAFVAYNPQFGSKDQAYSIHMSRDDAEDLCRLLGFAVEDMRDTLPVQEPELADLLHSIYEQLYQATK